MRKARSNGKAACPDRSTRERPTRRPSSTDLGSQHPTAVRSYGSLQGCLLHCWRCRSLPAETPTADWTRRLALLCTTPTIQVAFTPTTDLSTPTLAAALTTARSQETSFVQTRQSGCPHRTYNAGETCSGRIESAASHLRCRLALAVWTRFGHNARGAA